MAAPVSSTRLSSETGFSPATSGLWQELMAVNVGGAQVLLTTTIKNVV
jgi:hypothetical protein